MQDRQLLEVLAGRIRVDMRTSLNPYVSFDGEKYQARFYTEKFLLIVVYNNLAKRMIN